jgi:Peptidase propeptide and YPEB domain
MKSSTKLIVVGTLLGTLGLAGVARFANAGPAKPPYATIPPYHSSQMTGDRDTETNDGAKVQAEDQKESAKLQSLAKITPQQAQQAAEAAQGGKGWQGGQASSVKLENEDGNLVYAVVIGQREVKVDAGNGRVLYTELRNHEDKKTEASRPRSSIQVSEAPGGDGDGETNDDG